MATLTDFCTITLTLDFAPIGAVEAGFRLDVPFTGVATSSRWEGEKPVTGIDYVTVGGGGIQSLDIRARIGEGKDVIAYRAIGKGTEAGPKELFVFETASEEFDYLNSAVAVAVGALDGNQLTLSVSLLD